MGFLGFQQHQKDPRRVSFVVMTVVVSAFAFSRVSTTIDMRTGKGEGEQSQKEWHEICWHYFLACLFSICFNDGARVKKYV
jgi:hypothetical protein